LSARILVVDDERAIGIAIERLLRDKGHRVKAVRSYDEAAQALDAEPYHLVVTDLNLGDRSGMEVLSHVKARGLDTAVVMITAFGSERTAVEAMKLGAADYVPKPFDNDELELVVERALEARSLRRDVLRLQQQVAGQYVLDRLVGKSPAMQRVFEIVRKVADTDLTVLILGPSGTGKELVANALHYNSPRRKQPFIKVNCAAFSRDLVESELFGHQKGAFTGAVTAREGKFEAADGGTLLLDEIGDMPLETQAKILRVLQEREVERVGGNETTKVDVRVLAATNQDLQAKVKAGTFRQDLFYRLNVVSVALPALRDRREDVPLLVEHLLSAITTRLGRGPKTLSAHALRRLLDHDWPGNVRELEHALEQAVALSSDAVLDAEDLALDAGGSIAAAATTTSDDGPASSSFRDAKQEVVARFEREFLTAALARHRGNVSKAADDVGMYRQQLQAKLAELGIDAHAFRRRTE
jgi:DNA-binding NtrC family response regulator